MRRAELEHVIRAAAEVSGDELKRRAGDLPLRREQVEAIERMLAGII